MSSQDDCEYYKVTKVSRHGRAWGLRKGRIYQIPDKHKFYNTIRYYKENGCEFEESTKKEHDKQEVVRALE